MRIEKILSYGLAATAAFALVSAPLAASAAQPKKAGHPVAVAKQKLIIQVSDADPKKWALALNNAANVQEDVGKDNVDIELVAYGPGLAMLKLDSEVGGRVKTALEDGVKVVACENTMHKQKLTRDDMLPDLGYVKAGVVELMAKQAEGYSYIRP